MSELPNSNRPTNNIIEMPGALERYKNKALRHIIPESSEEQQINGLYETANEIRQGFGNEDTALKTFTDGVRRIFQGAGIQELNLEPEQHTSTNVAAEVIALSDYRTKTPPRS